MYAFLYGLFNHRRLVGNARALYYLVGIKDKFLSVLTLFPCNAMVVEHLLVFITYLRHV